ncbi:MAG TPA: glycine zipper 2TM domain-containing protein [Rhodocyclaceae bacterium]|nr:glycine zipper 2TM domain-containing protein [Rhodocyclaceae bacterium]
MKTNWIPALAVTALFSIGAQAHGWDDHGYYDRYEHHDHHRYVERVVSYPVYVEPVRVYQAPPPVIYRERVEYRQPVYVESPRYYSQPAPYYRNDSNRLMGQALGAVAGGVIGNNIGNGNGRIAATAVGAVVGSIVGGNLSR